MMTERDPLFDSLRWQLREIVAQIAASNRSGDDKTRLAVRLMGAFIARFGADIAASDPELNRAPLSVIAEHFFARTVENLKAGEATIQ